MATLCSTVYGGNPTCSSSPSSQQPLVQCLALLPELQVFADCLKAQDAAGTSSSAAWLGCWLAMWLYTNFGHTCGGAPSAGRW